MTNHINNSRNMNVFSFLPTTSFSLRSPYIFEEVPSSTPETLMWKNSAYKNVEFPVDLTEVLLNKRQSTSGICEMNGKDWDTAILSSLRGTTSFNFSPVMMTAGAVSELRRHGNAISKPNVYRKYQFLDRQQRHSQGSSFQCYVHPPDCVDQSQSHTGNELASLKALCDTDVSVLLSKRPIGSFKEKREAGKELDDARQLKFGMERILSDTFGKRNEQENEHNIFQCVSGSQGTYSPAHSRCHCSPPCRAHGKHNQDVVVYNPNQLPSFSAVQSLHSPRYSFNSSVDSLPGPYSVLSTDAYNSGQSKRKRSWSRAVFSNLQRKGLEKRFEVQKYVTKLDRRQLANMLGLTDAQVKVWFQNRRMKWRHAQQQRGKEKETKEDQDVDVNETDGQEENISNGSELLNEEDIVIEDDDQAPETSI